MRLRYRYIFLGCLLCMVACKTNKNGSAIEDAALIGIDLKDQVSRDLPEIREEDTLRVITVFNSTSYFLYRGRPMGFQYEMAKRLAKDLHLHLSIKVAQNFNELFKMLISGKGDMIAFGMTITAPRKKFVAFTDYLYSTHQVLVQRKPKDWKQLPGYKIKQHLINNPMELIGDTVYVKKNTSYYARLKNLEKEVGGKINIRLIKGDKTPDDIIHMVVDGKINYTVADYTLASVNQTYYPILDINTPVSFSQRIAWAVRKNSPQLLKAVNRWIKSAKKKDFYYALYAKYFKDKKSSRRRVESEFLNKNKGRISPYDSLIRRYADSLGWDWRLLTSLIYQESRFKLNKSSWTGASGLMQIIPTTAKRFGITNIRDPQDNIRAGTDYLQYLYHRFDSIFDNVQRIKLTMAAYNCGLGHVRDAQRLAKALGDNPHSWDNNVENAMLKLEKHKYFTRPEIRHGLVRGTEPYKYVREIFQRYKHYKELIPLHPQSSKHSK